MARTRGTASGEATGWLMYGWDREWREYERADLAQYSFRPGPRDQGAS
jgi:hypothetical protein